MDLPDLVPPRRLSRLLRQPLLHFLLLGALLHALQPLVARAIEARAPRAAIVVRGEDVETLRRDWLRDTGRPAGDAELRASLNHWLDQEVLVREAQRLGLDTRDAVVRERLLANLRFAFADEHGDADQLLQQARALHMEQRDPVVRRRLVQLMEQRIKTGVALGEDEIRAYVARHPERYAQPQRLDFEQRFFSRDRRGARAAGDAAVALTAGAVEAGDAFLLGNAFERQTPADIARLFGEDFAQALLAAAPGRWSGPIASPYGWHLVRVQRVAAAQPADWARVRGPAQYALLAEREEQALRDALQRLRADYPVQLPAGVPL